VTQHAEILRFNELKKIGWKEKIGQSQGRSKVLRTSGCTARSV